MPNAPSTTWKETIPEGEAARLEALAEQLRDLQRRRARGGKTSRALHAKGHQGLLAELTILGDLPAHARVGIFAAPATYGALVRFSNGMGVRQADRKPDVRGVAVKVLGVPGKKIIPGLEAATTQDFLGVLSPSTPFHTAEEFLAFVRAAANPLLLVPRLIGRFGLRAFPLLRRMLKEITRPVPSLATMTYHSAAPIRFGAYAVHYSLWPQAAADPNAARGRSSDHRAEELAARVAAGPVVFDFKVQFYVDDERTPIEDGAVEWKEADAPFVTLARLTIPKQDPASPRGRRLADLVERLSFDPWHTPEEFRPLGNIMRARSHAYRLSVLERGAAAEPDQATLRRELGEEGVA